MKTRGAHSFQQRLRQHSPPPAVHSTLGAPAADSPNTPSAVAPHAANVAISPAPATMQGSAAAATGVGSSSVAPVQRRYHTRVGPTPSDPSHPKPARRPHRSRGPLTSGPRESSTSRSQAPPSPPYQGIVGASNLSLASIIRRPYFHCSYILGNADYGARDLHGEVYYDLPAFAEDLKLRDSMLLMQRYHLEPFMMAHQFFYPRVVIEFYHTMTSRREANPTALHFSIDGRLGILRASDITATLHLLVVLANATFYTQWPHPSTREMVHFLSMDTTAGTILFKRQLP